MKNTEVTQADKEDSQSSFSLERERAGIRIMKWTIGLLALILLLSLILSMLTNP